MMSTESDEMYGPRVSRSRSNYVDSSDSYEAMMADPVTKLASNLKVSSVLFCVEANTHLRINDCSSTL